MTTEGRAEPATVAVAVRPTGPVDWSEGVALAVIEAHSTGRGPLLPVLHALQETFGYLPAPVVQLVAKALNLSRADVHGVITFYSDFRSTPPGRTHVQGCRAEACQSMGGYALADHARERFGIGFGETTAAGDVSLDQVYCLGNCALAPAVTVGGQLAGRVTPERFDQLLDARGTADQRSGA